MNKELAQTLLPSMNSRQAIVRKDHLMICPKISPVSKAIKYGIRCKHHSVCGCGSGGNTSMRNLWIISKLVKVITAAGVVRSKFVAQPR